MPAPSKETVSKSFRTDASGMSSTMLLVVGTVW